MCAIYFYSLHKEVAQGQNLQMLVSYTEARFEALLLELDKHR